MKTFLLVLISFDVTTIKTHSLVTSQQQTEPLVSLQVARSPYPLVREHNAVLYARYSSGVPMRFGGIIAPGGRGGLIMSRYLALRAASGWKLQHTSSQTKDQRRPASFRVRAFVLGLAKVERGAAS